MPFIRPIQLLRLQKAASAALKTNMLDDDVTGGGVTDDIRLCPVCGEGGCSESAMMVNDYLFHESDIADAEEVGVELP